MLEQDRITAGRGIKDTDVRQTLEGDEQDRNRYHGRPQNHDQAGRVVGPDEQGQTEPGHARSAHGVNRDDEVQPRQDR